MADALGFYPPRLSPSWVRCTQWVAPYIARWFFQFRLHISPEDRERLCQLDDQRLLLLPNHPTFHDPIVMFVLSGQFRHPCHFLAAYETFENPGVLLSLSGILSPLNALQSPEWMKAFFRKFLQRMGMYSIHRGLPDRASIAQSLDILESPDCHLVIFPEGGCSFQNDTVMPFRAGAVQLAFQAMNRFAKRGEPLPDIYVLPMAIKYQYTRNMRPVIRTSLKRLEVALGLAVNPQASDYARLRAIGEAVLTKMEAEYGLIPKPNQPFPWTDRVNDLKLHVIEDCERAMGITAAPGSYMRERVYRIQHEIRDRTPDLADPSTPDTDLWTPVVVERAMARLLNFDALYDGYVAKLPTSERFLDLLIRLEREVFAIDQPPPKGFRVAHVFVGDPINLKDAFETYRQKRAETVDQVISDVQTEVQARLDAFNQAHAAVLMKDE